MNVLAMRQRKVAMGHEPPPRPVAGAAAIHPIHTKADDRRGRSGPETSHIHRQRALRGNIRFLQSLDTPLEVTWILIWQDASLPFD